MRKIVILIILFVFVKSLKAEEYIFEKITTRQGLSQNDVNCIFQDHNGFLWIGTNDGLNRYDGYNFKTYRIGEGSKLGKGLSSNLIFKVKEDDKGRLWIATSNEGVCVFDVAQELYTPIRNTTNNPLLLTDNRVLDLECMTDGTVWIATEKGVTIISENKTGFGTTNLISIANAPLVPTGCNAITEDSKGRKWIGSRNGLIVCENKADKVKITQITEFEDINVRSILPVSNGLIIGSGEGLFFFQEKDVSYKLNQIIKISDQPTTDVYVDESQNLYAASRLQLMVYSCDFSHHKFKLKDQISQGESRSQLNNNLVMSIYADASGIIWIGTNGGGLNKYNPKRKKINHYKHTGQKGSISSNKIRAIFEDSNHNIWMGTEGGGVEFLNTSLNNDFNTGFKNYSVDEYLVENRAYAIIETKNRHGETEIWAGSGSPQILVKFKDNGNNIPLNKEELISEIGASIFTLLEDKSGRLWIGTYGSKGLYKYELDGDHYRLTNYKVTHEPGSISSNIIRSLLQDRQGNIWIGTDNGLNVLANEELNKEKPNFKVFKNDSEDPLSLSNNYILPLFQSLRGQIWVGTMGGGLNLINNNTQLDSITFTTYNHANGLPNNVIKGVLEDDNGNLWFSSNKGLSQFNPVTKGIMNYDISDGLQDNEFGEMACCKLSDGMMIFGGVNGFNTFYPDHIVNDKTPPKVAFTDLQVLNKSVKVGAKVNKHVILNKVINQTNHIKLKYSENSFAIYFSALHFSAPQKNKYKFMLEGLDKNWIVNDSEERFAKYTNLKPGKYIFKLYASNNDGVWSADPRKLEIEVIPPWWQSNFALVIYLVLFTGMLWFFRRFSFIRIKHKNQLMMEHFEKEKMEELNQMKFRFFTNISHEFRTPLTLISGSIQKLTNYHIDLPPDVKEKCLSIQRNSSIMLRLINQLMDFRKVEQDKMNLSVSKVDIVQFLREIYKSFEIVASDKKIQFVFAVEIDEFELWIDIDKIEKILYNLLSNAFKFTKDVGQIELFLLINADDVVIQVKDNGIGIPKEVQSHIFERFYQGTKSNQSSYNGTGIGLSYAKGLAELHKGDIRFDSIEGVGSCFELVLRKGKSHYHSKDFIEESFIKDKSLREQDSEIEVIPQETKILDNDNKGTQKQNSILLVEDNIELLKFLSDTLAENYKIYNSENGVQALKMLETFEIDLVVSDIAMPLKDGFELSKEIKTDERFSHIPIILLTAKTTSEDTIKGYKLGADAYVPKPFDINVLEAQIAGILKNKEALKEKLNKSITISPSEVTTTTADEKFLNKLLKIIESNISNTDFSVEQLAEAYGMHQININKKLKSLTGQTSSSFIRTIRLKRASQLLKTGRYTVSDVTYEVGFTDLKYFRACFKKEFKLNPSEYAKLGQ